MTDVIKTDVIKTTAPGPENGVETTQVTQASGYIQIGQEQIDAVRPLLDPGNVHHRDLLEAMAEMERSFHDPVDVAYRDAALAGLYDPDQVFVDDYAMVERGIGATVQAWVWVTSEDAGLGDLDV